MRPALACTLPEPESRQPARRHESGESRQAAAVLRTLSRAIGRAQRQTTHGQDQADLDILQDQVSLALLDLNELHSHLHNPTLYVETLGNALFSPMF